LQPWVGVHDCKGPVNPVIGRAIERSLSHGGVGI
jgi:hypothetical protein